MNILALTVTGDSNPRGSKTLDDSFKTSLFVIKVVMLGIDDFNVSDNVSSCVFHCSPKMFTGLLVSATLSLYALSISSELLEAQLLRLKWALFIMERAST